jgi:hypothetical protein
MSGLRARSALSAALLLPLLLLVSCPTPGKETNDATDYYENLKLGSARNIARFNDNFIYSIISPQPAIKPQANSAPTTLYSVSLGSSAGTAPSIGAPTLDLNQGISRGGNAAALPFGAGQRNLDLVLRETENDLLASRASQYSRYPKGMNPAAPPSPVVDVTEWTGIHIAVTGGTITATCRAISAHAIFYVENTYSVSNLAAYATAFETIVTQNQAHFGTENDTDGNGKVIILFAHELALINGLLGYFYGVDKFPYDASLNPNSNEGDIFYMTTASYSTEIIMGTLAHEYQHMIYFDEHYDRGVTSTYSWLNEALSQAAEYYNGYLANHLAWINDFLDGGYAGLSLTHWTSGNYGYGAIFIRYLVDRFGDNAIRNMCATNLSGVAAVEAATGQDFNTLFNDFTRALVMSGSGDTTDARYNFSTLDLKALQPSGSRHGLLPVNPAGTAGMTLSGSLSAYQIILTSWTGPFGSMTLSGDSLRGTAFGILY